MRGKERRGRKPKGGMHDYPAARLVNSLAGRVALTALATVGMAAGLPLALRLNLAIPPDVLRWAAAALLGVTAGLAARGLLADRTAALRLWAALLALLAGLVALGLSTDGLAGAALPEATQTELNWLWLVQFGLGAGLAWLTLNAFPVPQPQKRRKRKPAGAARPRSGAARRKAPAQTADDPAQEPPAPARRPRRAARVEAAPDTSHPPADAGRTTGARRAAGPQEQPAPSAPRPPAPRRRPVIHPQAPGGRSSARQTARTLWVQPPAAPPARTRRAAAQSAPAPARRDPVPVQPERVRGRREQTPAPPRPMPDLAQGWRTASARLQTWWRKGAGAPAGTAAPNGPSAAAHTPRPRRSAAAPRPAAQTPPARPRLPAWKLPAWGTLKERIAGPRPAAPEARPSPVRLMGEEEHRCPFCLELVEPDDARGIVECEICHTRHHADCWAVTGACQVPHYHG